MRFQRSLRRAQVAPCSAMVRCVAYTDTHALNFENKSKASRRLILQFLEIVHMAPRRGRGRQNNTQPVIHENGSAEITFQAESKQIYCTIRIIHTNILLIFTLYSRCSANSCCKCYASCPNSL